MKIYICAIMKNEEKNIKQFYDSCKDADGIYVLDTGSTDSSVELLKSMGSNVHVGQKTYEKFRFDVARNDAIDMLPKEDAWVIHLDIDEVLNGDWKNELSTLTDPSITNVQYMYVFDFKDKKPNTHFITNKITRNGFYKFRFPIHETIYILGGQERTYLAKRFSIDHYQDTTKKRNYITFLEDAVKEYPSEQILGFYLLKEHFIAGNYGKCIDITQNMFNTAHNSFTMVACIIAARSFEALGVPQKKEEWLLKSLISCPLRREPYMELMRLYCSVGNAQSAFWAGVNLFNINNRLFDFLEMGEAWGAEPHMLFVAVCEKLKYKELWKEHTKILNGVIPMRNQLFTDGLNDLISYFKGSNLTIAELGSYAGESSAIFAKSDKITKIYSIDPWMDGVTCEYVRFNNMGFVESLFDEVAKETPKIKKMKMTAAAAFPKIELVDIVYIDALHTYDAVKVDTLMWYSKVKPGGYLCGHDYDISTFPGVVQAVNEFCINNGLPYPRVFSDTSWVISKPL